MSFQLWGLCTVLSGFCCVKTRNCRVRVTGHCPRRVDISGCSRWATPCLSNLSCFSWLPPSALGCCGRLKPGSCATVLSPLPVGNAFFIKLSPFTSSLTASLTTLRPFLCVPDPSVNCQPSLLRLSLRPYSSGLTVPSCVPNPVSTFNSHV